MKNSEIKSKELYCGYLSERFGSVRCEWSNDPPDFVCICNGEEHAVEVTELHQYLDQEGRDKSRRAAEEKIIRICQEVEKKLGANLDRIIKVCINFPLKQDELDMLPNDIWSYAMRHTSGKMTLFGRHNCWLEAEESKGSGIEPCLIPAPNSDIPGTHKKSFDIQANINHAVKRILKKKLPVLERFDSFSERVLIIFSIYPFATVENIQHSLAKCNFMRDIITKLFLVDSDENMNEILESIRRLFGENIAIFCEWAKVDPIY